MKRIGVDFARELIDFSGSSNSRNGHRRHLIDPAFAKSQLEGTVAAHNMLAENRVAYIADEVGMGKTYVALGVMGLVRHFRPDARMLVVAPRENIQRKWVKELGNFVRNNWRVTDNRVKSVQGTPANRPTVCHSLASFARELTINDGRDFFLRMTSFSLALRQPEARKKYRAELRKHLSWLPRSALSSTTEHEFREQYGRALNALVPDIDVLVVDEAHNLKKGFGSQGERHVSNRNRILGLTLGHPSGVVRNCSWYRPRVKHVLCLSATPFEDDYGDIWRQLDVLGVGKVQVGDAGKRRVFLVSGLANGDLKESSKREIASNLLIRRVTYLEIGDEKYTKNMYRREWRYGGFRRFDKPIRFEDPRQRLIVGLVQKKVAEVLGDERFGNRFQIGMLSSFESFLETVSRVRKRQLAAEETDRERTEGEEDQAAFDGRQTRNEEERRGADTRVLSALVESYRQRFQRGLPHPKLDAAVRSLASAFKTGEKALVFVRRVATVDELAHRLDQEFDSWIRRRMEEALPELRNQIDELFRRFASETKGDTGVTEATSGLANPIVTGTESDTPLYGADDDLGGRENFFCWFFRGAGPKGVLSGAAFQRNRLSATAAVYSTLFEDDLVSWLLGRPDEPLKRLADLLRFSPGELRTRLRKFAWAYFLHRTKQAEGYPRYYVFEAYQSAALHLLAQAGGDRASQVSEVLKRRFPDFHGERIDPPRGFPQPESSIGTTTFFTELVRHPELRRELWPDEEAGTFAERFRRREQRRELLSAMSRLGAAYIDLYMLAIEEVGSFELKPAPAGGRASRSLAQRFVALLAKQREHSGFHAFSELRGAAEAFDTLIGVNFPNVPDGKLSTVAEIFGRGLQHQDPVGRMSGRVSGRTVQQFRMPGFPLVLVSTDVLQEGEDLHTFCRKVVHYGITWTPSAMEQRTGRVDRIGSLLQRRLDGRDSAPDPEEKIQVHYPHLEDTVERLQVRRVLQRLDRFMRLVHESAKRRAHSRRIDKNREILASIELPPPVEGRLESAFPVKDEWLEGSVGRSRLHRVDVRALATLLEDHWDRLVQDLCIEQSDRDRLLHREGVLQVSREGGNGATAPNSSDRSGRGEGRRQLVRVEARSAGIDGATFLQCTSEIGLIDLSQPATVDCLQRLQSQLGHPRLCARFETRHRKHALSVEASLPFDPESTQYEEFKELVSCTAQQADRLEEELLGVDAEAARREQRADHA